MVTRSFDASGFNEAGAEKPRKIWLIRITSGFIRCFNEAGAEKPRKMNSVQQTDIYKFFDIFASDGNYYLHLSPKSNMICLHRKQSAEFQRAYTLSRDCRVSFITEPLVLPRQPLNDQ